MPKYLVTVRRVCTMVETADVEVEADNLEEAKENAVANAEQDSDDLEFGKEVLEDTQYEANEAEEI